MTNRKMLWKGKAAVIGSPIYELFAHCIIDTIFVLHNTFIEEG